MECRMAADGRLERALGLLVGPVRLGQSLARCLKASLEVRHRVEDIGLVRGTLLGMPLRLVEQPLGRCRRGDRIALAALDLELRLDLADCLVEAEPADRRECLLEL
eukprot:9435116-Alexandrium_andersonii.AAC.1